MLFVVLRMLRYNIPQRCQQSVGRLALTTLTTKRQNSGITSQHHVGCEGVLSRHCATHQGFPNRGAIHRRGAAQRSAAGRYNTSPKPSFTHPITGHHA